jgi:hypothetical protein
MMTEVVFHILAVDAFEMASGDDSGCKGLRGSVGEFVDNAGLSCEDNGEVGFGVTIELGKDVLDYRLSELGDRRRVQVVSLAVPADRQSGPGGRRI